ncbi:hypothetical protein PGTUg99_028387 [Puccinia graminis f. sp. tritici]|uniref:Uncharacterized protein n=1 Tax=Puccinia graminis f. sp. tritici TaxID=56615 RepID=A0A5B0PJX5_PUCGR|nr:hypothetical protein PGTUg99_028387 [Puccinia graminis f. sp. tritici]
MSFAAVSYSPQPRRTGFSLKQFKPNHNQQPNSTSRTGGRGGVVLSKLGLGQ